MKVIYSQMLLSNSINNIPSDVNKIDQPKLGNVLFLRHLRNRTT